MSSHAGPVPAGGGHRATAVTNVTVHTMDEERGTLTGQTVVIEAGRISRMGRVSDVPTAGSDVVDGSGRYLMPGLTDMHAHLFAPTDLNLYLANGVVLVRDLWGSPLRLAMRDLVARGTLAGPRIVAGSPMIDGDFREGLPVVPTNEVVTDFESAAAVAERFVDRGYDQLKTYSFLGMDALRAVAAVGRRRGVTVTGHCPRSMTMEEAADAGLQCFEHLVEIGAGHLGANAPWPPRMFERWRVTARELDLDAVRRLGARFARDGVWNCPTLVVHDGILIGRTTEDDPYTPADMLEWWRSDPPDAGDLAQVQAIVECLRQTIGVLHSEGAPLLIGADSTNPGVRTGFSVHDELDHFRRAGLSTLDVLRCATVNAARFLGQEEEWGTVAAGMRADLVLTNADPLADMSTLRRPHAVLCNGSLLDRAALDRLLRQRAETLAEPLVAEDLGGRLEVRQGGVVVARGSFAHRPGPVGRTEIVEHHAMRQMGLSIDRSSSIVLDRAGALISARIVDETSVGQATFEVDRTDEGYRLIRQDVDGWEDSADIESPPLDPSNRLSPSAFVAALGARRASTPRRTVDLPVAGSLAETMAAMEPHVGQDGVRGFMVHRHGERSRVVVSEGQEQAMSIDEDRFHGQFRTLVLPDSKGEDDPCLA